MDKKTHFNSKVLQRISNDIAELGKNMQDLNENGIFWHVNEENIGEIFFVITGQEETPYAFSPFLFKFTFPENYPLIPPIGKFCTSDGHTRFNPNLYVDGKICLSILGTWSGPSWTPVMNIKTVIMSIIALVMTGEPVRNEPGWETARKEDIEEYNTVVEYNSLKHAIIEQITRCQECFLPLRDKMVSQFLKDFPKIIKKIDDNIEKYRGVDILKPRYGNSSKIDYIALKTDMIDFLQRIKTEYNHVEFETVEEINVPIVEPNISMNLFQGKKITPKIAASNFEVGLSITYEGESYSVKENKSGKKFWRKN